MPKTLDPVKTAKLIAKLTRCPLPQVAQVMQKYPLDGKHNDAIRKECQRLAAIQLEKDLKAMGL